MKNLTDLGMIIEERLKSLINNPQSELKFNNTFELLVAVMLSAQCTDKRVNIVTEKLFEDYKTPMDFSKLNIEELEKYIKSCNYYHNKAKNIINASKDIVLRFGGQVPNNWEDLVSLSGVGNKTANVVLAVGFGKQAFPVDTHVLRVSNRLGLVKTNNPTNCEKQLIEIFKNKSHAEIHHLMLLFGRYYCTAKKPKCEECVMSDICKYREVN